MTSTLRMRAASNAGVATRVFPLDDITIRASGQGGDGRTVDAYAAVFDTPTEVHDQDGHYTERIHRAAFNRSISHRGNKFGVFYNHGMTLHGTPSERHSLPLGVPLEVRADNRGVFTSTRYHSTQLADEVLESIRSGAITGQSFTGRMLQSDPARGPHRRSSGGNLVTVTRQEIGLVEYGPTPFPYYEEAAVVGLRAITLSDTDVMLLQLILDGLAEGDAALDPIVNALCKTDEALDQAQAVLAQILTVPNPDTDETAELADLPERAAYLTRLDALATRLRAVSAERTGTAAPAPAAPRLTRTQVQARLIRLGVVKR